MEPHSGFHLIEWFGVPYMVVGSTLYLPPNEPDVLELCRLSTRDALTNLNLHKRFFFSSWPWAYHPSPPPTPPTKKNFDMSLTRRAFARAIGVVDTSIQNSNIGARCVATLNKVKSNPFENYKKP